MTAKVVKPTDVIVLDLDTPYTVERVFGQTGDRQAGLKYERRWEDLDLVRGEKAAGDVSETLISYSGTPRVAPRLPWIGGVIWTKTPNGADWVSVALQNDGADLLFPVKDHPSDKASTATIRMAIPDPLVAARPG